ncbi:hypothetical protein Y600_5985 [Burkholderia pseudomallei MSHR3709]|nr:hypothetical protein Y600_5985 [Burkholderia pseudomallei MSHR3709]
MTSSHWVMSPGGQLVMLRQCGKIGASILRGRAADERPAMRASVSRRLSCTTRALRPVSGAQAMSRASRRLTDRRFSYLAETLP